MSSANMELVRSIYAPWARGDFSSAEWAHPEIEYVFADGPAPGTWKGLPGMAEGWRAFLGAWEEYHTKVDDYRELDAERVLVLVEYSGRGKTSGLELRQLRTEGANVFHIRDGKVTRFIRYFDRERALADFGLPSKSDASGSQCRSWIGGLGEGRGSLLLCAKRSRGNLGTLRGACSRCLPVGYS